ncbi:phosphodiester glycosidase family protein [Cohnella sp. AR92]|uniref:phosphodiester glycosidase family protein n=1 Tax=Cohnella sp. AR92 TaxID=648716 RepID=UPI000F8F71A7|nr:phosphodiester glycosidase family protein [Cohnella sp. AR92]RUS45518.1 phosphodiester glycosidase family protein [Cohnella sp. AR92]
MRLFSAFVRRLLVIALVVSLGGVSVPAVSRGEGTAGSSIPSTFCQPASMGLSVGTRIFMKELLQIPDNSFYSYYETGNPQVARISSTGLLIPVSAGKTNLRAVYAEEDGKPVTCVVPLTVTAAQPLKLAFQPKAESKQITAAGKKFAVRTVAIPKGMPVDVGLGGGRIGGTEPLAAIVKRKNASVAINGTFFEAYGGIPEPWGTVIADGEIAHSGNYGTTIGFTWDGKALMDSLRISVSGQSVNPDGRQRGWYAYFINRTPAEKSSSAVLFTSKRGERIGFAWGTAVVVERGIVTRIAKNENVQIPKTGFVVVYTGTLQSQADSFGVGRPASYKTEFKDMNGKAVDWSEVATAIGAGPRVVKDGKVEVDAVKEGFSETKILSLSAARSGIGIKADGSLVLATVNGATVKELGAIMQKLGAVQAMNLDGGASSGLAADGKMITTPGRNLSNALVFGTKLSYR